MNMKEAKEILYPLQVEKEKLPEFETGEFYLIDSEIMQCIKVHGEKFVFSGAEFAGREFNARQNWAKEILLQAVPALPWEIRDMQERKAETMASACRYFNQYGTASE